MYSASSFIGAWFWDIGTGLRPILLFYTTIFVVMVASFALASRIRQVLSSPAMMTMGIILNAAYLALLLLLQAKTRYYYIPLAILDGLSSSFYWLSLFVLASSWVEEGQASWYNSWTGAIEAVLGLIAPPVSGWIIHSIPGLDGYRTIFFFAFLSLIASAWLILGRRAPSFPKQSDPSTPKLQARPAIPAWLRLCWSFWGLGLRDGMYFFVPNLLLYIVTGSTISLGLFTAMQAALEGMVFWVLTRSAPGERGRLKGLLAATLISLLAMGLLVRPLDAASLFVLGAVIAISYPPFKVTLETAALTAISRYGRNEEERTQLTGLKEVWINAGRLFSLVFLVVLLSLLGPLHLANFRWILGLWALVPLGIYFMVRGVPQRAGEGPGAS
jgi:YQGE family putative transporter